MVGIYPLNYYTLFSLYKELDDGGVDLINPAGMPEWMRKAYGAAQEGATVVCLVPSRTDTEWWHRYAMKGEVRLLRGRGGSSEHRAHQQRTPHGPEHGQSPILER